ncbi:MAG: hypothetical protein ACR2NZ_07120 [Rubripirellula sp.]
MATHTQDSRPLEQVSSVLTDDQERLCHFTFDHCGHLLYPNYEQWEAGLVRGGQPNREISYWIVVSAYMIEHNVTDPGEARDIIRRFISGKMKHCFESFNIRRWLDKALSH